MVMIEPNPFYSTKYSGLYSIFYDLGVGRIYICTDISSRNELKQYATAMSTFIIFIIVLTLGYMLYYAAMITIDMTAKEKSEAATEETIDADGEDDDDDEYAPRSVVEDSANGGFSISDSAIFDIEDAPDEIPEDEDYQTEEEPVQNVEELEDPSETEDSFNESDDDVPVIEDSEEQSSEKLNAEDGQSPIENRDQADEATFDEEPETLTSTDGEDAKITVVKYSEDAPAESQEEPFDEDKAFDKTLFTPKYDVTEIVTPPVSLEVWNHAIETNAAMASIFTKAKTVMDSQMLGKVIRQGKNNKYGIETTDEVQKY